NPSKTANYLNTIADVSTRWNFSYLACSINPTIAIIMTKVYPSTSSINNFDLNKTGDAFNEILELEKNEDQIQLQEKIKININIPVETQELFDQVKKNLYKKDTENELYKQYDNIKLDQSNPTSLPPTPSQQ
ncbi:7958_t:CDS:2, partial [Funneliformis caledonium]